MRARGDVKCFHEPFMYHYYLGEGRGRFPHFEPQDDHPQRYDAIKTMLFDAAEAGPVFFKDMSYYVIPDALTDDDLLTRVANVFLVRDPRRSIASYYKLDPELSLPEIGLEAQYRHASHIAERLGVWPLVLEADRVQADPQTSADALFAAGGLPPAPHALDLGAAGRPKDWEGVANWHREALSHDRIRAPETLPDADEVFEAAAHKAPRLRAMLDHHWPFYEKLRARAL
ncbi:hypothetical protein SAMN04490248_102230 [Salinihabitans flavidus]|uniref:Sulfotransferase family protein n=2 Tax=Salinihabitans flavidus TaxID=569882 RepID=A0A1H8MS69_9RHOB|nr:hypothetical protein SAMN04490248_102230 [Salinihabitans flavidus]